MTNLDICHMWFIIYMNVTNTMITFLNTFNFCFTEKTIIKKPQSLRGPPLYPTICNLTYIGVLKNPILNRLLRAILLYYLLKTKLSCKSFIFLHIVSHLRKLFSNWFNSRLLQFTAVSMFLIMLFLLNFHLRFCKVIHLSPFLFNFFI